MALFPPAAIICARDAADAIAFRIDNAAMTAESATVLGRLRAAVGALEAALSADFAESDDLGFWIVHDPLALQQLAADIETIASTEPALTWPLVQASTVGGDLSVIRYIFATRRLP